MTAPDLLDRLEAAGVPVRLDPDGMIRLPRTAAAAHPELLSDLKSHRRQVIEVLRRRVAPLRRHPLLEEARQELLRRGGTVAELSATEHPCVLCRRPVAPGEMFCGALCWPIVDRLRRARRAQEARGPEDEPEAVPVHQPAEVRS